MYKISIIGKSRDKMQTGGFQGLGIERRREKLLQGCGVLLWVTEVFRNWIEGVVTQHCECTKCH